MQIILADVQPAMVAAWQQICGDLPNVSIQHGSILDCTTDAVVSPANSFGFMDGGIDMLYSRFFGWHVQERLQTIIQQEHFGELLIGKAALVPTDHANIPFVIAAPTMRVPMILQGTVNPYLACRAVLLLIKHGTFAGQAIAELVKTVAIPGLGTGVGRVAPEVCARQIRAAIEDVYGAGSQFPSSWWEAQARHQWLYGAEPRDLQREQ
ncbi:macro domain-containing protein [Herpetosiphon giganteus]|uniref:macro domain-containing protein n=1 Tax=Herpetosiphon giganteus TaxID=2029754 RepID=UPI00195793E6|nr:macro domain-containing protein [Herpetosiphon giganteus]MBM7841760.1 O-acetyl-ADP-ribose deacetylase (regulator of RNase III) [Herpetosiphon giganteus]